MNEISINSNNSQSSFKQSKPFETLPGEINFIIFSILNDVKLLCNCSLVNKKWKAFVNQDVLWDALNLKVIFPALKIIDGSDWKAHVDLLPLDLTVDDETPINQKALIVFLQKLYPPFPPVDKIAIPRPAVIENNKGITLLTISKGLTFDTLFKLAMSPKQGNAIHLKSAVPKEIKHEKISNTYRIIISNHILSGTRGLTYETPKFLQVLECERPRAIELTALLVMTYLKSGEYLYNNNPTTYAVTSDRASNQIRDFMSDGRIIETSSPIAVGGFNTNGLVIKGYEIIGSCYGISFVKRM